MSRFKVGDKVVYMVYGLDNAELHTVAEVEGDWILVQGNQALEEENDFVLYEGSEYQWRTEGRQMYANQQARIRQLEDQLATARAALEPFAELRANWDRADHHIYPEITDYIFGQIIDSDMEDYTAQAASVYRQLDSQKASDDEKQH